jgi:cell division cycle 14
MPFRDAGYSQADYGITVQDIVYGVWKAKEEGCCVLEDFDLEEYERYERVEHGDFNWITPHFLAFASPMHQPVDRITEGSELFATLPKTLAAVDAHPTLPQPFKNVLKHFSEKKIGLVVRLNSELYSPSFFESMGIHHLDMIFEDGTCPPLSTVRKFVRLAHEMITVRKKGIAVHCKAGLGRTGCLIGAYLIYRHGFTANEIISYMRFMRPGMVVGPQQHWLHLNQGVFREWWVEERIERRMRKEAALAAAAANGQAHQPSTPIRAMQKANLGRSSSKTNTSTPPNRSASNRTPLGEMDRDHGRDNTIGVQEDYLPAPTPGQPRKAHRNAADRHHPYSRNASASLHSPVKEEGGVETKVDLSGSGTSQGTETDEELHLRMRAQRKASASPISSERRHERSVSHQMTTTTTTVYEVIDNDASRDIENIGPAVTRVKAMDNTQRSSSASGVLAKVRGSGSVKHTRPGGSVRETAGVRKTSGRVGSAAATSTAAATTARKISGF